QTQVATVIPYYRRFMARFPTVEALAAATVDEVLKAWEGLGYYRRAHHLHRAAQMVVREYGGRIPDSEEDLRRLPGVGRYTAAAILSLAFGRRAAVLDGNVRRVLARLYDLEASIDDPATEQWLWQTASELVDPERPGPFNEAMMELGATICVPRTPACSRCPLRTHCLAQARGTQYERPVRATRRRVPHYDVVAGVVRHRSQPQRFLIARRPDEGMLGGLWEFPGGKIEKGESAPAALHRELQEELGIEVEVGDHVTSIDHAYTHFRITLHAYHARHVRGEPQCLGVADWRWVTREELGDYAFARTDRKIIAALG
ncbi:MAG: A/G-specific adenine glycosylase, partial [Caldilineae bacterium]